MRLLAYTTPARGDIYPLVPILQALTERGHSAFACTLSDELGHLAQAGIEASAIDPAVEGIPIVDWQARTHRGAVISALNTFAERAEHEARDLAKAIAARDPDILLININSWGAATMAEASGRPWAIYSPYLLPLPSRDVPPYGPGLRPLGGPLGAIRDAFFRDAAKRIFAAVGRPSLNALRARHSLPGLERFEDFLEKAPLLLSLTAEGFEYRHGDWPAKVRLVGPMNWSPPAPIPAWLADMRDPLVLVTSSTELQGDERLLSVALAALPPTGMSVVATSAAHEPDAFQAPLGSKVVRFVPHEPILERAACVVCHGGLGITQKALSAGVPVVVVPFGRDQMETARRVEHAKAGVYLSRRRLTAKRLAQAVGEAVDMRDGAQRMKRIFQAAGGSTEAADAIEALRVNWGGDSRGDKIRPSSAGSPTSPVAARSDAPRRFL